MRLYADLHIHSRFSRACSKDLTIQNLEKWARIKGIDMLGTGDFSHPEWNVELRKTLSEDGTGVLKTSSGFRFILQNEISLVYTQGGKGRRIHLVLLAPDFATVDKITKYLGSRGRLDYDGRPIFGISCIELVRELKSISDDIEIIPAHVWTPWFGLFGSKSGFDSVIEAFADQEKHIYALETGLSSDISMNRLVAANDKYRLVSFSDSHSYWPWRLGREATIFELEDVSYKELIRAIRTGNGLAGTLEVDPAYGKYHFDGHRACGVVFEPAETKECKGICPKCGKPLTVGVLSRVTELEDRSAPLDPEASYKIVPLSDLIAFCYGSSTASKRTWDIYNTLIDAFGSEFHVLLDADQDAIASKTSPKLASLILRNRNGEIQLDPGYDGEYGKIKSAGHDLTSYF